MSQAQKDRVRKRFFTASVSDAHKPRTETTTNASRNSSFSIEARGTGINCDLRVARSLHFNFIFLSYMPVYFGFQFRRLNLFFHDFFLKIISLSILNIMLQRIALTVQ